MWPAKCAPGTNDRRFCLILVKPSHYDDDGYVIQWLRSAIPSNSLAALYGLARDCAERRVLGDDVDIAVHAFDETNTRIRPDRTCGHDRKRRRRHGDAGRRAVEPVPARPRHRTAVARARNPCRHRRLPRLRHHHACWQGATRYSTDARHLGMSLFAGEAEGRLDEVLRDADAGASQPLYNFMNDLPGIEGVPMPVLPASASSARPARSRASMPAAAAPINAPSAPSSTCRAESRAAGRPTTSSSIVRAQRRAGAVPLLHHRRQFRAQQGLGADPRPPDPAARGRENQVQCDHSGRHALPPASELHRKMRRAAA